MQSLHSAAHRWPLTCSDYRTVSFFPPLSKKKNVFFTQFWLLQHTFSCTLKCPRGCRKVFHSGGPNFTYYKVSVLGNIPKSNGDRLSVRRGGKNPKTPVHVDLNSDWSTRTPLRPFSSDAVLGETGSDVELVCVVFGVFGFLSKSRDVEVRFSGGPVRRWVRFYDGGVDGHWQPWRRCPGRPELRRSEAQQPIQRHVRQPSDRGDRGSGAGRKLLIFDPLD